MADTRVTKAFRYVVETGTRRRVTKAFRYTVEGASKKRVTKAYRYSVESVCGAAPKLSVTQSGPDSVQMAVDPLPEYEKVWFRVFHDGVIIDEAVQTGELNYIRTVSGMVTGETYVFQARVRRDCGWSPFSNEVELLFIQIGEEVGCPPFSRSWLQNPDGNPPNLDGLGWFHPLPGEPLRGAAEELILRHSDANQMWEIEISDDLGETYSSLASEVVASGETDGDGLPLYKIPFDTTVFSDGQDYRLRAVGEGVVYESLSFPIDNSSEVRWWTHRGGEPLEGRFAKLWAQAKTGGLVFGPTGNPIWHRGLDGGIAALGGQDWAAYVDLDTPPCLGADITLRFYIWSSEGGLFGLGGRDDTELFEAGPVFMAQGLSVSDLLGMMVSVNNFVTWPLGCCDDYLTSTSAGVDVFTRPSTGGSFLRSLNNILPIKKMRFKAVKAIRWISDDLLSRFPVLGWRNGSSPGENAVFADDSCARRYEMYSLRARVEVDPLDRAQADLKVRLDGPGVDPPETGYWHAEETVQTEDPWECGRVGFGSRQHDSGTYYGTGDGLGARVFMSFSALPFEADCVEEICPPCGDNPPVFDLCPICTTDTPTIQVENIGATSIRVRGSEISPRSLTHVASRWRLYLDGEELVDSGLVCGDQKDRTTWEGLLCDTEYESTVEHFGWDEDEGVCCLSEESLPVAFTLPCVPGSIDPVGDVVAPDCPRCVPPATEFDQDCEAPDTSFEGCASPSTVYEEEC